jgi:hypothetical protein
LVYNELYITKDIKSSGKQNYGNLLKTLKDLKTPSKRPSLME